MNGVLGMADLLLDTGLNPEQRECACLVKASADSLLTVINDILDFSKIEAGKLELESFEFNLQQTLASTIKTLAVRAHQKGLELTWDMRPEVPEQLVGDPGRLRQVLVNLLGNAVKFTERGEVGLRVGVDSTSAEEVRLHFVVLDTGMGIAPEKQKLIFEAFSQADGSTARKFGGTGLGLTISSRIVEMMGGRIWVESVLEKGSAFHFTANFGMGKKSVETSPGVDSASLARLGALIVDDNATNRRVFAEMLRRMGMRCEVAENGAVALQCLKQAQDRFAVILTDLNMPNMNGFELVEQLRRFPELTGAAKVIMLTSAGQRGDAARCRELRVAAYLTKPVCQSELSEAVVRVLSDPETPQEPAAQVTPAVRQGRKRKLKVLLVEDNAVNQKLAARLLEKDGHTVTVTSNGREALAALGRARESPAAPGQAREAPAAPDQVREAPAAPDQGREAPALDQEALTALDQQPFDIVLMDVQMPEMDGFEATAAIRAGERGSSRHIPIVAMTAHAMQGDRERCLAAGMDSYLSKPIKAQQLTELLEKFAVAQEETSPV
jgi:two-component system, sensor histidine kinase and response regulator